MSRDDRVITTASDTVTSCPPAQTACAGVCQNLDTDSNNCGACGNRCPNLIDGSPGICVGGVCQTGLADCNGMSSDGCETTLMTGAQSCGQCGRACPVAPNAQLVCAAGQCLIGACQQGFADCNNNVADGCGTNLMTSLQNCGQ